MGITNRPISRGMLLGNSRGIVQNALPEDPQPSCLHSAGSATLGTTPGPRGGSGATPNDLPGGHTAALGFEADSG